MEKWKEIKGFENYEVSDKGNVRRVQTKHVLKQYKAKDGYYCVELYKCGKRFLLRVNRVVYQAFVGEFVDGLVIDHIDGNKLNNNASNLQQIDNRANVVKGYREIRTLPIGVHDNRGKFVSRIQLENNQFYLGTFDTKEDASAAYQQAYNNFMQNGLLPQRKIQRNTIQNGMKVCSCCGQSKPLDDYYFTKKGIKGKCKTCYKQDVYEKRKSFK